MFRLTKKAFIDLLRFDGSIVSAVKVPNHTTYISLNNQPCIVWLTAINLNTNENSQGLHFYPYLVKIDECNGSWNTFNDFSTEYINLHDFNMMTGINNNKHLSRNGRCTLDGRKCKSNQKWNKDKCWCECKNPIKMTEYLKS